MLLTSPISVYLLLIDKCFRTCQTMFNLTQYLEISPHGSTVLISFTTEGVHWYCLFAYIKLFVSVFSMTFWSRYDAVRNSGGPTDHWTKMKLRVSTIINQYIIYICIYII